MTGAELSGAGEVREVGGVGACRGAFASRLKARGEEGVLREVTSKKLSSYSYTWLPVAS